MFDSKSADRHGESVGELQRVHGVENLLLSLAAIYKHLPSLIVTEHNFHRQDNVEPPSSPSSADPPAYATTLALPQDGDVYARRKLGNWLTVMAEKIEEDPAVVLRQ